MYKVLPKGDRVLRIEAIVHNAKKEFARGYGLDRFSEIVEALRSLVERFLEVLRSVEACWVSDETWESLSEKDQGYPPLSGSGRWAADHHGGRRASGEDP